MNSYEWNKRPPSPKIRSNRESPGPSIQARIRIVSEDHVADQSVQKYTHLLKWGKVPRI